MKSGSLFSVLLFSLLLVMADVQLMAQKSQPTLEELYAQTKQVGQFIRRFNGEEDLKGTRIYDNDNTFRTEKLRRQLFPLIFDTYATINAKDLEAFQKQVLSKPQYLEFYGDGFMAEVRCRFLYKGVPADVNLFMKLEKENEGHKWVIDEVYFPNYNRGYFADTAQANKFLHPMSHELDFMNLNKVFAKGTAVEFYAAKDFYPSHLSIFLNEYYMGLFKFETVNEVRFHFLQIPGWYFEVTFQNRAGKNSGWLMTNLLNVSTFDSEYVKRVIMQKTRKP